MVAACTVLATSAATADVRPAPQEPTKAAVLDMGPGCRIKLQVPSIAEYGAVRPKPGYEGEGGITIENPLKLKRKTYIEPFYLRFICHDADPEALSQSAPLRYDARAQTWRKDMQKLYDLYIEPSPSFKRALDRAVRIHEMKSVNAQGFAYTLDDVTGEESTRRRVLYYCLMHGPKAVCNSFDTRMGYLPDIQRNPRNDLTPYALKILRSIEFLDDAVQAAPAASR